MKTVELKTRLKKARYNKALIILRAQSQHEISLNQTFRPHLKPI